MLTATVEVMGIELSEEALDLFVYDLSHLSDEAIAKALARCRREIRPINGFVRLTIADVLDRAGILQGKQADAAEATIAWDTVTAFAKRHIERVPGGGDHDYRVRAASGPIDWTDPKKPRSEMIPAPELGPRIEDSVRRIGGWATLKGMDESNYAFVKRDFVAEFMAWSGVEAHRQMLGEGKKQIEKLIAEGVENKRLKANNS
jgi:hypothetical protein